MVATVKITEDTTSLADIPRALRGMEDQIPFATALALTRMSQDGRRSVQGHLQKRLDRPTKRTISGVRFKPADKKEAQPTSFVWIVDEAPKGSAPADYLAALIEGGRRKHKRHEKALHRAGILPSGWFTVPGKDVNLNKHGNITAGKYTKILSELQASPDPGQNATDSTRSTARRKGFFVLRKGESRVSGGKPIGVYQRTGKRTLKSILHFVPSVSYTQRIDLDGTVNESLRLRASQHVNNAIDQVIESQIKRQGERRAKTVEGILRGLQKQAARQASGVFG